MKPSGKSKKRKKQRRSKSNGKETFGKWFFRVVLPLIIGAVIEQQTGFLSNVISNAFQKVEYKEAAIVPLFCAVQNDSLDLGSARNYAESYGNDILDNGCVLSVYLQNNKPKSIAVSENALVIDNIRKIEEPRIYVIGEYKTNRNEFWLYAINNGRGILDYCQVDLQGNFLNKITSENGELNQEKLKELLAGYTSIEIENLQVGEIRKIAEYKVNGTAVSSSYYGLSYTASDSAGNNLQKKHTNIGQFTYENNEVIFYYSQGSYEEFIAERSLQVKMDEDKGQKLYLPANYMIESENLKNILFSLYPDKSCELEFHAEIKCAGQKETVETERFTQEIYVPLYKEEDYFFFTLREFLSEYAEDSYFYNSNKLAQKKFEYEIPGK